jgi:hypothetical protein
VNPSEPLREIMRELSAVMLALPPLTHDETDRTCRILDRLSEELAEVSGELRTPS